MSSGGSAQRRPPVVMAHDLAHAAAFAERLGLGRVVRPIPLVVVWSTYVLINGFISIALLALLAVITGVPFVFPSLGPTAYLLFFTPRAEAASPHNTLIGHAIALACGYAVFWALKMPAGAITSNNGLGWELVVAAGVSLGATGALMILLGASHPPAGATTLIVSLGIISRPEYLAVIEAAVVLLTIQAFCINRLAGVPYPIWKYKRA